MNVYRFSQHLAYLTFRKDFYMELNIADNIRKLRKEMGKTQEEFANAIGVTTQAVSRWERNEGYPDITLLPHIAEYFDITLDTLCGIDEQRNRKRISDIITATSNASYDETVCIAREGLSKFPHSIPLKNNLAEALMGCTSNFNPSKKILSEVIELYEDIRQHHRDLNSVSPNAPFLLCKAYMAIGEQKKAKEAVAQINGKYEKNRLFCLVLKEDELVSHIQNSIIQTLPDIHFMVQKVLDTDLYTTKEKISLCKKMIGIYSLFDECQSWPIGLIFSYMLYLQIAVLSIKSNNTDESLIALNKAADLAIKVDMIPSEGFPSSLLLNRISFQNLTGEISEKSILRQEIETEENFLSLRNLSEFELILTKLK